ncbi:hypothetical protein AMJ49_04245 [Parcubacteria bacterium DG_74_2]|nr:MAG: hypothetical protein AMJ49_04245 [Parcubacteria bacterium DG_74_2]
MSLKNSLISIVIRAYNEEKHIKKLMEGVFNQDIGEPFEVIVVDSGSTDKTLDIISNYQVKIVHIAPKQFSFGYSLNRGIKESKGDYLVFISAHCYPKRKDWLKSIIRPFEDDKVGLVYGKQRGNHLTKFSEQQIFYKLFPEQSMLIQKIPFCSNANAAIRCSIWKKIPYDETLTGLEDLDWANKILKFGYHIFYNSDAEIIHVHEESLKQIFRRYERESIALKKIFPETSFNFLDFLRLCSSNLILDYLRALKSDRKMRDFWEIPIFRFLQFWGTYKGYNYKKPITDEVKRYFYYPRPIKKFSKKKNI